MNFFSTFEKDLTQGTRIFCVLKIFLPFEIYYIELSHPNPGVHSIVNTVSENEYGPIADIWSKVGVL